MKLKKTLILYTALLTMLFNSVFASKLPDDVWKYVKSVLPNAQQRFDSVVTLENNVMYIPLYPPSTTTVDVIKVDYTYPASKTFKDLPEVILLNNGYSFLKVTKDAKGNYTLTKKDDLPIKVRIGLMPQDLLTPVGLKIPESLKLTLGDILIPTKEDNSLALDEKEKAKTIYNPTVKRNEFIPCNYFNSQKIYINPKNSKFIEVYDNKSQNPLYELKLSSMPLKIITSDKSKVALVLYWSGKNVEIISLADERVIATIPLEANASDVVLDKKDNVAYVSSKNASAIYAVDLTSMQLKKVIKLDQKPSILAYSQEDKGISFYDEFAMKVYNVTNNEGGDFVVQPMGTVYNTSKIVADIANIYALSRTDSQLQIFDKGLNKQLKVVDVDKKPIDAILYDNKLYILCAKEGYMDVYDIKQEKIISREQISKNGFYSKITLVPDGKNLLITGINSSSYLIYNLDSMKVVKKQDSYMDVANIIILDKGTNL